jgi:hypothetical protein
MRIAPIATAAFAVSLLGATALAQAAAPHRARGTIDTVTASQIDLTTRAGAKVTYKITADTHVVGEKTGALTDIQPGSYIGSAAVPASGGKLRALEVSVFPPAMKGTGDGHYAWDLGKSSSMTNGTVSGPLVVSNGNTMTVKYKGGEKMIEVPADVPVVTIEPKAVSDLAAGQKVIVFPAKGDATTAAAIVYGEAGITPPQ